MMNISGTQSDKPEDDATARRPLADDVLIELTAWQSGGASGLITALNRTRRVLTRPRVKQWLERATGAVFVALGIRLAATS